MRLSYMVVVEGFEFGFLFCFDEGVFVFYIYDDVICRVKLKKFVGELFGCGWWWVVDVVKGCL